MKPTHLSLFSGIGGIDLAAEWAGFETVGQVEWADYPTKVLEKHWPDVPRWRDIFDVTGREVLSKCGHITLLSGGFPCQPFSVAGNRKGTDDERHLWPEMLRLIREIKPTWVLGENVRGLLSIDDGRVFGRILSDLAESGYRVGWVCYGAGDVGAPHQRDRVFVVGYSTSKTEGRLPVRTREKHVWADESGQDVAHADTAGIQGREESRNACGSRQDRQQHAIGQGEGAAERFAESCLGRVLNGFPARMDGDLMWSTPSVCGNYNRKGASDTSGDGLATQVKFPAGPGDQYDWEPPRVAKGVKNRVDRLKGLGNAVVPQQVYPILQAIYRIIVMQRCCNSSVTIESDNRRKEEGGQNG